MGKKGKKMAAVCLAGILALSGSGCSGGFPLTAASGASEEAGQRTAGNRLEAVQQLGKLRIGISADYAPCAFEIPGEAGGIPYGGSDIELGTYIAQKLGVEAEFVEMDFEACMNAVEEGSVDLVLLGMLPEAEREEKMDFTRVYYKPGRQVLLVKESQKGKLSKLEDFEGKTVAAQYGSLQAQLVAEQLPGSYLELTERATGAVLMLRLGTAAGAVLDEAMAQKIMKERPELVLSGAELPYDAEGIVGGVVKGETELLTEINAAVEEAVEEKLYLDWLDAANEQAMLLQTTTR